MADINVVRDDSDDARPQTAGGSPRRPQRQSSRWAWIVPLLLLAVVFAWWAGGPGDRGSTRDAVGTTGTSDTIRDLRAANAGATGTRTELENVSVASVTGDRTFWITDDTGGRALVIINERGGEQRTVVTAGQRLEIQGTLVRANEVSSSDTGDRQALGQAQTVIQAERVTPSNR